MRLRPMVLGIAFAIILITSWAATIWQHSPSAWIDLPVGRYQILAPWGIYVATMAEFRPYMQALNAYRLDPRGRSAPTPPNARPLALAIGGLAVAAVLVRSKGKRKSAETSTSHGSARWATGDEVRRAGLYRKRLP
jgi:hypothetical protein